MAQCWRCQRIDGADRSPARPVVATDPLRVSLWRLSVSEPPQDRLLASEQPKDRFDVALLDPAPGDCHAQVSHGFVSAAGCNSEVVHSILTLSATSLRKVGRDRRSRSNNLLRDFR